MVLQSMNALVQSQLEFMLFATLLHEHSLTCAIVSCIIMQFCSYIPYIYVLLFGTLLPVHLFKLYLYSDLLYDKHFCLKMQMVGV